MKQIILSALLLAGLVSCQKDQAEPKPMPVADFTYSIGSTLPTERSLHLLNSSKNADRYQWDVSGVASNDRDVTTVLVENGRYNISLTAKNDVGQDTKTQTIDITDIPTTGSVVFWSKISTYGEITINVNTVYQGKLTRYSTSGNAPACSSEGFVTMNLPAGTYAYTAKSQGAVPLAWSGSFTVSNGICKGYELLR